MKALSQAEGKSESSTSGECCLLPQILLMIEELSPDFMLSSEELQGHAP